MYVCVISNSPLGKLSCKCDWWMEGMVMFMTLVFSSTSERCRKGTWGVGRRKDLVGAEGGEGEEKR